MTLPANKMETLDDKENGFPAPKPLSGGPQDGMPSWTDYLASLDGEADLPSAPATTSARSRHPVQPQKSAAQLAEEAEKARKRKEEEEARRKKFREMREAAKKDQSKPPLSDASQLPTQEAPASKRALSELRQEPPKITKTETLVEALIESTPTPTEAPTPAQPEPRTPSLPPTTPTAPVDIPTSQATATAPSQENPPALQPKSSPEIPGPRIETPTSQATATSELPVSSLRAATLARFEDILSLFEQQIRASIVSDPKEIEDFKKQIAALQQENQVLQAKCARLEIKTNTLEETLKSKENSEAELTKLCESLISKLESLT